MFPFHYDGKKNVGYLEDALEECPGLYIGKSLEKFLPVLKEIAAEAKLAFKELGL